MWVLIVKFQEGYRSATWNNYVADKLVSVLKNVNVILLKAILY